jgi:protein TonB
MSIVVSRHAYVFSGALSFALHVALFVALTATHVALPAAAPPPEPVILTMMASAGVATAGRAPRAPGARTSPPRPAGQAAPAPVARVVPAPQPTAVPEDAMLPGGPPPPADEAPPAVDAVEPASSALASVPGAAPGGASLGAGQGASPPAASDDADGVALGVYRGLLHTHVGRVVRYPEPARRRHLSGDVQVELTVAADGRVLAARVLASPHPLLAEAASVALVAASPLPPPPPALGSPAHLVFSLTFELR